MVLGFGNFAGNVNVCACINGSLKIPLRAAGTPCDAAQGLVLPSDGGGCAPCFGGNARGQGFQAALAFGKCADVEQVLVAESGFVYPAYALGELDVVAEFGMRVQRQMIGNQVDAVGKQGGDALFFPAGDGGGFAFPKHAVVDKQGIRAGLGGKIYGGAAGGYGGGDFADAFRAFHLQAVGGIVFELGGLQGGIAPCGKVLAGGFHCQCVWGCKGRSIAVFRQPERWRDG